MNYLLKSSRRKSGTRKYVLSTIVIVVVIINLFRLEFVQNIALPVIQPIQSFVQVVAKPFSGMGTYFQTKSSLEKKIEQLQTENRLLEIRYNRLSYIEEENKILREILERKDSVGQLLTADVLLRPPQTPYDLFRIDKGAAEGVATGDFVYAFETFIGVVQTVSEHTSFVKLLSAPGQTIPVELDGGIIAEAVGQGGGRFVITVPKDIVVEIGARVLIDNAYAPVLGVIQDIEEEEVTTFQELYFNLPFSFSELRIVEIIPRLEEDPETL